MPKNGAPSSLPLVSVIVPTYNRAELLREALCSACHQTYAPLEILVMDDASTDHTPAVVEDFSTDDRVRYIRHEENRGLNRNWHAGIEAASGDFYCFLADDDVLLSRFVERLVEPLVQDNELVYAFCDHWVIDKDGKRLDDKTQELSELHKRDGLPAGVLEQVAETSLLHESVYVGAVMFRRTRMPPGVLDVRARSSVGAWLLYNAFKTGYGAYYVPERLMNCRHIAGSVSRSTRWLQVAAGDLYRYRLMLDDPDLKHLHEPLRRRYSHLLRGYGRGQIAAGEHEKARSALAEAWSVRKSPTTAVSYVLGLLGESGTKMVRLVQQMSSSKNGL